MGESYQKDDHRAAVGPGNYGNRLGLFAYTGALSVGVLRMYNKRHWFNDVLGGAAFGAAVGIGASTSISVKLGQRDYDTAENILGNTVTLNLIIGSAFGIICLIFLDPILRFFGASDATIPYARSFMEVILAGNVISHMYFGMNAVLRAASKPRQAMMATIFTVLMNIVLDFIFIRLWGWGIRGAAFATVLSQGANERRRRSCGWT